MSLTEKVIAALTGMKAGTIGMYTFEGDEFDEALEVYENWWYIQSDPDGAPGVFRLYGVAKRDADTMMTFRLDDVGVVEDLVAAISEDVERVLSEEEEED